jgi:hypothetical protein
VIREIKKHMSSAIRLFKRATIPLRPNVAPRYHALLHLSQLFDSVTPPPEALFLGDSVSERISRYDQDRRDLRFMLRDQFKNQLAIAAISHTAYNLKMFFLLLQALQKMRCRPRLLVWPLNLRSFSPQWYYHPEWQLQDEIQVLNKYILDQDKRILPVSESKDSRPSFEDFDAIPVKYDCSHFQRIGHFRLIVQSHPETTEQRFFRWQQIFIFHYMYKLDTEHPLLKTLQDILELLRRMEIIGLIYTTPINYMAGERFVGTDFRKRILANCGLIRDVIAPYVTSGLVKIADWSTAFDSSHFFHENEPTEHLNEIGRRILTDKLVTLTLSAKQEAHPHGKFI